MDFGKTIIQCLCYIVFAHLSRGIIFAKIEEFCSYLYLTIKKGERFSLRNFSLVKKSINTAFPLFTVFFEGWESVWFSVCSIIGPILQIPLHLLLLQFQNGNSLIILSRIAKHEIWEFNFKIPGH